MEKVIYLFRHGETDWNKAEKLQGIENIPLNEVGIEQAKTIAELLKNEKLEHIYSSPLDRAYETGKIVANSSNIDIEKVEGLKEVSFGDYSGKTKTEIRNILGDDVYNGFFYKKNAHTDMAFPNGDKKIDIVNKFTGTVIDIAKTTKYNRVGIAAHGFVIRMFLIFQGFAVEGSMKNCRITKCIYSKDTNKIEKIEFLN